MTDSEMNILYDHAVNSNDLDVDELQVRMTVYLRAGYNCYVKWTCPTCGERVVADESNTINLGGYRHTERLDGSPCGATYQGSRFGFVAVLR